MRQSDVICFHATSAQVPCVLSDVSFNRLAAMSRLIHLTGRGGATMMALTLVPEPAEAAKKEKMYL